MRADDPTSLSCLLFLQGHFFSPERPDVLNYGGIGTIMGHELTHSFDAMGRMYDAHGSLQPKGWWSPDVIKKFAVRERCFQDEYSKFTCVAGTNNTVVGKVRAVTVASTQIYPLL